MCYSRFSRTRRLAAVFAVASLISAPLSARAEPHEARIALHDGRLAMADVSKVLIDDLHLTRLRLPPLKGSLSLRGIGGSLFIKALNGSLGDGFRITMTDEAMIIHFDSDKLPHDWDQTKYAGRTFAAIAAPKAAAAQKSRWELALPENINPDKPLVVLIHGLDCDSDVWSDIARLLGIQGYQAARFSYPADGPIADSAEMFASSMADLRREFPSLKIDIIAHSMGALVARDYVEGASYGGGVEHLILLTPPNHGSNWAGLHLLLKLGEHAELLAHDKDWSPVWMITDGLGEAARDLKPDSSYLKALNALPRRQGVQYTMIAGDQNPFWRISASATAATANWAPVKVRSLWGIRQIRSGLEKASASLAKHTGNNDGPVSLESVRLEGVSDLVVLPADHDAIYHSCNDRAPAAWQTIESRLAAQTP